MNLNFTYIVGIILLTFGLFWSFLPHLYHEKITEKISTDTAIENNNENNNLENNVLNKIEERSSHIKDILIGVISIILGLILIEYYNRKLKKI